MGAADLGRYRLKRVLGRGAMGEVWEAQDTELARRVAVKIMHATDDELALARTRFAREARVAAVLRHPNIVVVHDAGEAAGTCFMVMELVEGKPLRALVGAPGIPIEDKLRWIRQIGDALVAMHNAGIVHRDVKPDNVIVRADGSACLVDFGIAKWTRTGEAPTLEPGAIETAEDMIVGTPDYLPPETRHLGIFDEKSDQYAWGVMAYELLAGVHPLDVNGRSLSERADVPRHVVAAIERARSKLPKDRWPTIDDALDALSRGPPSRATRDGSPSPSPKSAMPNGSSTAVPFVIGLLAVLAVGASAGVLLSLRYGRSSTPATLAPPASSTAPSASSPPPNAPDAMVDEPGEPAPPLHHEDTPPGAAAPRQAAASPFYAVAFSPALPATSIEDFERRHAKSYHACIADAPAACRGRTLKISCLTMNHDGVMQHCTRPVWMPATSACEDVQRCLNTATHRSVRPNGVDPSKPIDILIKLGAAPMPASAKPIYRASVVVGVSPYSDDERKAISQELRAPYEACILEAPSCAVRHTYRVACSLASKQCEGAPVRGDFPADACTAVGKCLGKHTTVREPQVREGMMTDFLLGVTFR